MAVFHFKYFSVIQDNSSMKVGTDAMVLGSLVNGTNSSYALDIGTGTGVLSLMLAQENDQVHIKAVELDAQSAADCRLNFANSPWSKRLECIQTDFLQFTSLNTFDLIVTNPPFFENSLKNPSEGKALARHTDSLPLDGLAKTVSNLLSDEGAFWIILPTLTAMKFIDLAFLFGMYPFEIWNIEGKPGSLVRKVICFKKTQTESVAENTYLIRDENGKYSEQYKFATLEFHHKSL